MTVSCPRCARLALLNALLAGMLLLSSAAWALLFLAFRVPGTVGDVLLAGECGVVAVVDWWIFRVLTRAHGRKG